jgi:hypothetical protein
MATYTYAGGRKAMAAASFDHDKPDASQPQDWEYGEVDYYGAVILVSKVGGGTLGRQYEGSWHYSYTLRDRHVEGSDLWTGFPQSHVGAAQMVSEFLSEEG